MTAHPFRRGVTALLAAMLLAGCGEKEPIRLGYVGGLTGRTADLGTSGRNGLQIALDQVNAAGGIKGRKVEVIFKDDENDPEKGLRAVRELIDAKVATILGPMTSNVAVAVTPLANQANVLLMAGPVTTAELAGKDDQFFRTIAVNTVHAETMATFLYQKRGVRRISAAVNMSNKAYTESWINSFAQAFVAQGGQVDQRVPYTSATDTDFSDLTSKLLANTPDAVVFVTSAVDVALFANQARLQGANALMVTSEWAGTGKLTEIGGANVDGYIVPQYLDPQSQAPIFAAFRDTYRQRFQQDLGFPAVVTFNAAQVVFKALAAQQSGESLKQTLLRVRRFDGLLEPIVFDDFGDVQSKTFLTEVRDGQYHVIQ
jgi:branched-chain amino acid transport system substrate-binding protein